jgi:hypothetical protein
MARFRASIHGRHGSKASRLGDESILCELSGSDAGLTIFGKVVDGEERFYLHANAGRGHLEQRTLLGVLRRRPHGVVLDTMPETRGGSDAL